MTPEENSDKRKFPTFKEQLTATKLASYCSGAVALLMILILLMYFSGDPLGILRALGLKGVVNRKTGVHVDCSLEENATHPYCNKKRKKNAADKQWETMRRSKKGGSKFKLYD